MNKKLLCVLVSFLAVFTTFCYATASERLKATGEQLQGTTQEVIGKSTGNEKLQSQGKANKTKGNLRNTKEDVKDTVNGLIK